MSIPGNISNKRILISTINQQTNREYRQHIEQIIELEKILKHIRTEYGQKSIINLLLPRLYDKDFIYLLDNSSFNIDYFPISKLRVVYLPDSTLHPRQRKHYFTHFQDFDLIDDPDKYSNVVDFMKQLRICNDLEDSNTMYNFSNILLGSSLSGRRDNKNIILWYGKDNNSRTICNYITSKILGHFYLFSPSHIFIDNGKGTTRNQQKCKETLRGKRYFNFSGFKQTDVLNEDLFKSLDESTSKDDHSICIYGLPSLETNWLPDNSITNNSITNRVRIVFCNTKFVDYDNSDPKKLEFKAMSELDLKNFIQDNINSFFAWYLTGCRVYYQNECQISYPSISLHQKSCLLKEQNNFYIFDQIFILKPPSINSIIPISKEYACKNNLYKRYEMEIKSNPQFPKKEILIKKTFNEKFSIYLQSHNCYYPYYDKKKRFVGWSFVSVS